MSEKVIKGVPIYVYKRKRYRQRPKCTRIYEVEYDEENYTSYVYLKKKTYVVEVFALCLLIFSLIYYSIVSQLRVVISVPDTFEYYNGTLYCNIVADENNTLNATVTVGNNTKVLTPGDYIAAVDNVAYSSKVDVNVSAKYGVFKKTEVKTVDIVEIGEEIDD